MSQTAPPSKRRFTTLDQFFLSCLWLGYNLQWGALLAIVLPSQVAAMVGEDQKYFYNGLLGPIGGIIALIVTPIAGALSDRSRHPWGRRRPFLVVGAIINTLFLLYLARFGPGSNYWLYLIGVMGIQFGCNWLGGPYAGLIPDVVPKELTGRASGWQALMTAIGFLVGAVVGGRLIQGTNYWPVYLLIVVAMGLSLVVTVLGTREQPVPGKPEPFELGAFIRSFWLDPREHRNFYWVLITRAFQAMGVYSIFTFFQYLLEDVVKVPKAQVEAQTGTLIGIILAMGIPTSILAGALSDKYGRKPMVYASGAIMAVASIIFIGVTYYPSLPFIFVVAALFGLGNGAYQAVDWALAVDVLPEGGDPAKDMGIWHVSFVLPQIIAPFMTGAILNAFRSHGMLMPGYTAVFVLIAIWFILATVFVKQVRGVR